MEKKMYEIPLSEVLQVELTTVLMEGSPMPPPPVSPAPRRPDGGAVIS